MAKKTYIAEQIALVFLALLLPPAAVALVEGCDISLVVNLLLLIVFWPIAVIHAIVVVCYYGSKPNRMTPRAQKRANAEYLDTLTRPNQTAVTQGNGTDGIIPAGTGIETHAQEDQTPEGLNEQHGYYDDDAREVVEVVDFSDDKRHM